MKQNRFTLFVTIYILTLLLLIGGQSHAFDDSLLIAPKEAEQAAQEGLQYLLNTISDWELPYFNFHSRDEFKDAKVGTPFRVFLVAHTKAILRDPKKSLIDVIYPSDEWFFPVISKGEYRTILKVEFTKNRWKAFGIGGSDLAKSFAHVLADWPNSKGYKYVFVRDRPTYSEFIILIHPQNISVIPLPNSIIVWGLKEERELDQSDALSLLKKRIEEVKRRNKKGLFNWW